MSFLVTFPDGHETLCTSSDDAELMQAYWAHQKPTIRDLDQEAKDREEMIRLLLEMRHWYCGTTEAGTDRRELAEDLLKHLGRLP